MAQYETYTTGCARCLYFAEVEESLGGKAVVFTAGPGNDCKRHRCTVCGLTAPEEGHPCEQRNGEPVCDECLRSLEA
jgi:hypothetical protein